LLKTSAEEKVKAIQEALESKEESKGLWRLNDLLNLS
jgi:phenylalanyl-tRNA synthetase alpha chain